MWADRTYSIELYHNDGLAGNFFDRVLLRPELRGVILSELGNQIAK